MRVSLHASRKVMVPVRRRDELMGTEVLQEVHGINAGPAAENVAREIRRLETLWSAFRDDTEIGELHRFAGIRPVAVSPETICVLSFANSVCSLSSGAFDISLGPVTRLWRDAMSRGNPPADEAIATALKLRCCAELSVLPEGRAYLPCMGARIDLGGIGKGFAADRACELYREAGIRSAFVSLGGNVAVVGRKPDGSRWKIGIRNPAGERDDCIGYVEAEDCSVVTSGAYERFFRCNGVTYHHIIDPFTGRPSQSDVAGVTVIAASSMAADALSTAAFVLGIEKGMRLIESARDMRAVLVDRDGLVHLTNGAEKEFTTLDYGTG